MSVKKENPILIETLSEHDEIELLQNEVLRGSKEPLSIIHKIREDRQKEDEAFGDYVEELLSQPFIKPEIQTHGIQWLKSRIKIEQYRKYEVEAASMIANFAFRLYLSDREKTDFILCGPSAKVRVIVFEIDSVPLVGAAA